MSSYRTIAQAIEDASYAEPTRGFRFIPESGVPGFQNQTVADSADGGANETTFSFTAIERATARYGGALQALGLRRGDRVALILPSNEDFILCFFGAIRAGIIPVPIYPPMGLGQLQAYLDNTRHIIAKSGARAIITAAQIKRLLGTVQQSVPSLEQVVAIEGIRESMETLKPEKIGLDDVAFLQFTSGSTSRPKGVTLTHGNLAANITRIVEDGLKLTPDDFGVSWLPLYHDMGLIGFVLSPIYYRIPIAYMSPLVFLKRPVTWLQAFSKHKASLAFAPNFAYALCVKRIRESELEGLDLSRWRIAGCGAEPIRPETLEGFSNAFAKIGFRKEAFLPSYGMAESSLAIAFTESGEGMKTVSVDGPRLWSEGVATRIDETAESAIRLVSCGGPFKEHKIGIYASDDLVSANKLPDGSVGEIRIAGPSVMSGYWDDGEKTREAFAGPMLRTGDLGFFTDGRLYICGRSKEVVIVNGRNYYPQDMEWEASKVDGVRKGNVIAFGARDPSGKECDRERVVIAFEVQDEARMKDANAISLAVRRAVQEGMSLTLDDAIALPAGTLPKTSSGKLQRAKTRELYELGQLASRGSSRDIDKVEVIKQAALSQLSYFKLAVLGGRKKA